MRRVWIGVLGLLWVSLWGQITVPEAVDMGDVGERANPIAQTLVDALRTATGADMAMLGAAFFDETYKLPQGVVAPQELLKALVYPDDEVVVLELRGEQILQALERSLELYPQKNNAFLQLAGAEVRFDPKAPVGKRVVSVSIMGGKLEPSRTYRVATTAPLARGALGYFRIWSKDQIVNATGRSIAETLKEPLSRTRYLVTTPAWVAQ
ncbi:5'-nucleotidase, C-terminal domain [Armatimonadetes bacterium GBS]|jgi:5'-nucleotidase/UDP-sugar diphosphatase|nr:5'-nucleotidase, C-terminal domain [Armatimonadetes bacterium GBS]CUU38406.1 5'-nucleotidase, C-terminal domain [Armatimonadetes bacterium GXS]